MFLTGARFVQQWAEALDIDPEEVTRIVIDAQPKEFVRVYVEKIGSDRLLQVQVPPAAALDITIV